MMIHNKWSTPIEVGDFSIEGLADHILLNYNMSDPPADNNYNIFNDESKPISDLKQIAYDNFAAYINRCYGVDITKIYKHEMKAWITGHGDHYSMAQHNHMGSWFSSVYYVLAEEQDKGGEIVFGDPRSNANRGYDTRFAKHFEPFQLTPKTGQFVNFPSFVYHHVNRYYSKFRIAIPIDLYLYED